MQNSDAFQFGVALSRCDSPAEAIERLGLDPAEAALLLPGWRPVICQPGDEPLIIDMSAKHRTKIALEAGIRGIYMGELCALTLAAIGRDGLFGTMLE